MSKRGQDHDGEKPQRQLMQASGSLQVVRDQSRPKYLLPGQGCGDQKNSKEAKDVNKIIKQKHWIVTDQSFSEH